MENILVSGGAGYIGSHTVLELLEQDYNVTVVDNLSNSSEESLRRVEKLTDKKVHFHEFDLRDQGRLDQLFSDNEFNAVIHFAALKVIDKSIEDPIAYYDNNLGSTLVLCQVMQKHKVRQLVFSSSAAVYGKPESVPITEDMPVNPTNPYGHTKAMTEQIFHDLAASDNGWRINMLRYFNPIGAHESGQIGEDPNGIPDNIAPYISQVAIGKREVQPVYGNDYETPDGTGVRDYIHVVDLAIGHIAALKHMPASNIAEVYNLGTGKGASVLELISAFKRASGKDIPYEIKPRRPGDIGTCYADVSKARRELHWQARKTLEEACSDIWRWQSQNPNGYR
jgi:UDP-glucose 4-epimerase